MKADVNFDMLENLAPCPGCKRRIYTIDQEIISNRYHYVIQCKNSACRVEIRMVGKSVKKLVQAWNAYFFNTKEQNEKTKQQ